MLVVLRTAAVHHQCSCVYYRVIAFHESSTSTASLSAAIHNQEELAKRGFGMFRNTLNNCHFFVALFGHDRTPDDNYFSLSLLHSFHTITTKITRVV